MCEPEAKKFSIACSAAQAILSSVLILEINFCSVQYFTNEKKNDQRCFQLRTRCMICKDILYENTNDSAEV